MKGSPGRRQTGSAARFGGVPKELKQSGRIGPGKCLLQGRGWNQKNYSGEQEGGQDDPAAFQISVDTGQPNRKGL